MNTECQILETSEYWKNNGLILERYIKKCDCSSNLDTKQMCICIQMPFEYWTREILYKDQLAWKQLWRPEGRQLNNMQDFLLYKISLTEPFNN